MSGSSQNPRGSSTDPPSALRVFILPPELGDGQARSLVTRAEMPFLDLFNLLEEWLDGATDGEEITIGWRLVAEEGPHAEGLAAEQDDRAPAPYETMQVAFEAAIGGAYQMPDGRDFWIDGPVAREIAVRIVRAGFRFDSPDAACPCCGEGDAFGLSSHMCGGCHRFVCGDCKVDAAGEPSPCHGICKDCRAKGLDEGALANCQRIV